MIEDLTAKLRAAEAEVIKLKGEVNKLLSLRDALNSEIVEQKEEIVELKEEIERLKKKLLTTTTVVEETEERG